MVKDVLQDRLPLIAEAHMVEDNVSGDGFQSIWCVGFLLSLEDIAHPVRETPALLMSERTRPRDRTGQARASLYVMNARKAPRVMPPRTVSTVPTRMITITCRQVRRVPEAQ